MQIHKCKHCGHRLVESPELVDGDWVLPCFTCGALNVFELAVHIVGVRF